VLAKCPVVVILQVREILQEEEDLSEIVQLVGKVTELLFFRPHRSTAYVDAAYCYRPSSMVFWSVGLSVTLVSPAKTAAPIEMPFGYGP